MPVKHYYKNGKYVAQEWTKKKDYGDAFIVGVLVVTLAATGFMWWKINRGE